MRLTFDVIQTLEIQLYCRAKNIDLEDSAAMAALIVEAVTEKLEAFRNPSVRVSPFEAGKGEK